MPEKSRLAQKVKSSYWHRVCFKNVIVCHRMPLPFRVSIPGTHLPEKENPMCACHESPTETCAADKSAEKNAATPPLDNPPSISAEELHVILLKAFKVGNLAR
ncbi:MAG: hypothetical protein HY717_14065, partial [Planctomycetes bacterium]|nr:hypothetical protein [Planctomycetota bacterium]